MAADPETAAERPLRLFIAIEIPPAWRDSLIQHMRQLEAAAPGFCRWVRPEGFHVTLAFLGNQMPGRVAHITGAMRETTTDASPFNLHSDRLGYFGPPSAPRVLWAGIDDVPPGALASLRSRLTTALQQAEFELDPAPFRPHITLGRARRGPPPPEVAALPGKIESTPSWAGEAATKVEEIVLFQSELLPGGAVYTALHREPLAER